MPREVSFSSALSRRFIRPSSVVRPVCVVLLSGNFTNADFLRQGVHVIVVVVVVVGAVTQSKALCSMAEGKISTHAHAHGPGVSHPAQLGTPAGGPKNVFGFLPLMGLRGDFTQAAYGGHIVLYSIVTTLFAYF
ncbi:unnamed protein product [Ectocarpus sp. 8 AP-2014]